jgi:hypothetical protein
MYLTGYKVMRFESGYLISGADSRLSFPAKIGSKIKMPGNGIYLSTNKEYVMDYYSGLFDNEVLVTLSFDSKDVLWGNLSDKDVEVSMSEAVVKRIFRI